MNWWEVVFGMDKGILVCSISTSVVNATLFGTEVYPTIALPLTRLCGPSIHCDTRYKLCRSILPSHSLEIVVVRRSTPEFPSSEASIAIESFSVGMASRIAPSTLRCVPSEIVGAVVLELRQYGFGRVMRPIPELSRNLENVVRAVTRTGRSEYCRTGRFATSDWSSSYPISRSVGFPVLRAATTYVERPFFFSPTCTLIFRVQVGPTQPVGFSPESFSFPARTDRNTSASL